MTRHLSPIIRNAALSLSLTAVGSPIFAQSTTDADAAAQAVRFALATLSTGKNSVSASAVTAAPPPGPKKPGAMRIGIVLPSADMGLGTGANAGEPIRDMESGFLNGPAIETVSISARLPMQAYAEAKASECDYVLMSTVSQKKSSGGGLGALKALGTVAPLASMVPGVGIAATMASMATAQSLAMASSSVSSNIKARTDVTLEYSLHSLDGTTLVADSQKAKTKKDGEDVLTSLVQQAAGKILERISRQSAQ